MTDIPAAIAELAKYGIESFELAGVLTIPCGSPEEIYMMANKVRGIFKGIDYQKSWRIDPYYYVHHNSLTGEMFDNHDGDDTNSCKNPIV